MSSTINSKFSDLDQLSSNCSTFRELEEINKKVLKKIQPPNEILAKKQEEKEVRKIAIDLRFEELPPFTGK
jgi:hypothetical protein